MSNRLEALQVDEMGFPADDEVFQVDEIRTKGVDCSRTEERRRRY